MSLETLKVILFLTSKHTNPGLHSETQITPPKPIFEGIFTSNGTPYSWLAQYSVVVNNDYEAADFLDSDNDDQLNYHEYISGTDPTDNKSRFTISALTQDATTDTYTVTWNSASDRQYTVLKSDNLEDAENITS